LAAVFDSFWFAVTKLTDLTGEQQLKTIVIEPLVSSLDAAFESLSLPKSPSVG
jgi:hypothetical protein